MSINIRAVLLQQTPYKTICGSLDHSLQTQRILANVILDFKHMLSGAYLDRFLVDYFRNAEDFDDTIMELSLAASSLPTHNILHFVVFGEYISISSSTYMVVNGTTGAHIWEAGVALGEYLLHNQHYVCGKSVIELGCGTGFCGIVAEKLKAKAVTVTDLAVVLDKCTRQNIPDRISMMELDWRYPDSVDFSSFDLLIASDVIFDPAIIPCLVELLTHATRKGVKVIICQKIRNESTFELFLTALSQAGIRPDISDAPPCKEFYYSHKDIKFIHF